MAFYKKLATVFAISLSSAVMAHPSAPSLFPRGCEVMGYGFSQHFLILNQTGNQTLYLIQNHSSRTIELEHYETQPDAFMSPKLESQLSANHWAAFASDVKNLYFQCFVRNQEERVAVDCGEILDVCQYPRVKFALSNKGNYWVSTDKQKQQVLNDASAKGIFLHW